MDSPNLILPVVHSGSDGGQSCNVHKDGELLTDLLGVARDPNMEDFKNFTIVTE